MPAITLVVERDKVSAALVRLIGSLTPARMAATIGPPLGRLFQRHLAALGPNKQGWPTTRFYEKFARNVRWMPISNWEKGVYVAILPAVVHGRSVSLCQRVFGGPILPKRARALAIPISPVSYGHSPADFPGLFLLKTRKGAYLAQYGDGTGGGLGRGRLRGGNRGRRLRGTLNILFKLSRGVMQEGDRSVLPSDEEILDSAIVSLMLEEGKE